MGLLFSSVQAADVNETEEMRLTIELTQDTELVAQCRTLHEQGLSPKQVVEQLMQSEGMRANVVPPMDHDRDFVVLVASAAALVITYAIAQAIVRCRSIHDPSDRKWKKLAGQYFAQ